jgi:hypothetical protein
MIDNKKFFRSTQFFLERKFLDFRFGVGGSAGKKLGALALVYKKTSAKIL